jgi:hypothetical protein
MAERLGLSGHDQLHHFIGSRAWDEAPRDEAPLWRVLAEEVDRQVGGAGAVLVVDDRVFPRRANFRSGWRGSTAASWARWRTARCWSR